MRGDKEMGIDKLLKYEDKLLKQEKLLKRSRVGALLFCIFIILGILYSFSMYSREIIEDNFENIFILILFLGVAWECTLKLRHIQTIKYYRNQKE